MSTYTFELPNFSSESDIAERALRGMDSVSGVSVDKGSETITVTSELTHGEMLDVIRQQGVSAK
ncbi:hypothetical protein [Nocardia huaxiensis]|uniref:HMA domain-containing protein n=1 Tax=Nocardia huaxiensis TaxID=2755382 RepID=A0A7D6Z0U0_9NOCA|nr:hypothetical protein [Nocardia huaxiensis]QLY27644.1 hypothetical protein H0264_19410 [Nocardia huaxiensis]UFS98971.1 hypothetical protein LPY97_14290 [Nocardia huaxiensis]